MATQNNRISQISLGTGLYDIYDASAIHSLGDLGIDGYMQFKGAVAIFDDLPKSDNKVGDVYHVIDINSEYIWVESTSPEVVAHWEEFGSKLVIEHTHSIPALEGTATVTGHNEASSVSGTATVTGHNGTSSVSGTATITVPSIEKESKYAKITSDDEEFVTSYTGATSKMETTSVISAGSKASVINSVTPSTQTIKGVSGTAKVSKIDASNVTASKVSLGTAISITPAEANGQASKVSNLGSVTEGDVAQWAATVENEVLSFTFTSNTPTAVVLPTFESVEVATVGESKSIPNVINVEEVIASSISKNEEITVAQTDSSEITVVTGVETGSTDVATVGSEITVATGKLSSSAGGDSVMTGLGTKNTASALTSATLESASSGFQIGDRVTIGEKSVEGSISGTAAAQTWTQDEGSISGTAAAQVWIQDSSKVSIAETSTGTVQSNE